MPGMVLGYDYARGCVEQWWCAAMSQESKAIADLRRDRGDHYFFRSERRLTFQF